MAKIITENINLNKLEDIKKTDQVNFLQTDPIKTEIERMIELKRKNKAERRLKSSNIKHLPKQEVIELCKIEKDKKSVVVPSKRSSAETPCNKIILAKKNPDDQLLSKESSMCMHESTLGIPKNENIKIVPEEMKKLISNKLKKPPKDPFAKYRNLKITYMPIQKPKKSETETFLPVAKEQFEGKLITIEEKDKILNFRFELLRRLNEEFQNQVLQQHNNNNNNKTCENFDEFSSANNKVKNLISSMKLTKLEAMGKIVKEIPKEKFMKSEKLSNKPTKKPSSKNNDDDKKNSRSYSTDSRNFDLQKIDLCENILENMKVATIETFDESCDDKTFNIEEALPKAFTCSSPDLEEERQDDLYYKYHNMSFCDIHEYLARKRSFAAETAEKGEKEQVEENLSSIKNEKK